VFEKLGIDIGENTRNMLRAKDQHKKYRSAYVKRPTVKLARSKRTNAKWTAEFDKEQKAKAEG